MKKRILSFLTAAAVTLGLFPAAAMAAESDVYVLMDIPYSVFYAAEGVRFMDNLDAVSSATNKTGNYGKAGGVYHSGTTARVAEDESVTATGGETGSQPKGVIWAVKAASLDAVKALGGTEITDESVVTTATVGRGKSTSQKLYGYETLTEAKDYSYYVLSEAPSCYMELNSDGSFSKTVGNTVTEEKLEDLRVQYGTNWGDVQIAPAASAAGDKLVNAVAITAQDANGQTVTAGLYALDQIWASNSLAWKVAVTEGLDGKTITNIRYYCTVKDADLTDTSVPAYVNYVYDYPTNAALSQVYAGKAEITVDENGDFAVANLPEDAANVKAKIYHTTGGRNPVLTYITPLAVDPADDDIDPVAADVVDGKVKVSKELVTVTNNRNESKTYGKPLGGTTYTVELSCDNYMIRKTTVQYPVMMQNASVGGVTYFFADGISELPDTTPFEAVVKTRKGATIYNFTKADLTRIGEKDCYYVAAPGSAALEGTLYGYGEGTKTNYKEVYAKLGVSTDASFDVVSSATKYTSHHAGDIPSFIQYGTDTNGDKAITGMTLSRKTVTVDAKTYVEACILKAAGMELTKDQEEAAATKLKVNPMKAPSQTSVPVALKSITYKPSKYGTGEFAIVPDDTVEGYVWSEYWDSIYAATVSNGKTTVGTVHWIDLYGEKAVSGPHYNTVELELNNGAVPDNNPNGAVVNRFAAFFDKTTGALKDGTYTVNIYAEGYDVLTAKITFGVEKSEPTVRLSNKKAVYTGANINIDKAVVTGEQGGAITYQYFSDKACTKPVLAHKNAGTYFVKASIAETETAKAATSNVAVLTITKAANKVTKIAPLKKQLSAKKLKVKKQRFQLKAALKQKAAVTFKLAKAKAKVKKFISVSKKGIVTVKKGTPRGKYQFTVIATAAEGKNHKSAFLKKGITVVVK